MSLLPVSCLQRPIRQRELWLRVVVQQCWLLLLLLPLRLSLLPVLLQVLGF